VTAIANQRRAWLRFARKWSTLIMKPEAKWLVAHEAFKAGVRLGRRIERSRRAKESQ
jgi:hypothetical protein